MRRKPLDPIRPRATAGEVAGHVEDSADQGDAMKTSVMEVHDMLSVLSVLGVEERIGKVPGVESVTVNYAAGSATVRYDETRLDIAGIKSGVRQGGHESEAPAVASAGDGHEGHAAPGAAPAAAARPPPVAPANAGATSTGAAVHGKAAPDPAASTVPKPSPKSTSQ